MKIIELKLVSKGSLKKMVRRSALEADAKVVIDEPCIAKHEGKVVFIYDQLKISTDILAAHLNSMRFDKVRRANGLVSTSRVFGFKPRMDKNMGQGFCSDATLNSDSPKAYSEIQRAARAIAEQYHYREPGKFVQHVELTKKVRPHWIIKGTPFTSGIINRNNPLKYHYDAGNFKDVFSCMLMMRRNFEGGNLCLPEYGVKLKLSNNSLFMFDGQKIIHGVTPILANGNPNWRYTIVFYSLLQMWRCTTIEEELVRVREKADRA